MEPTRGIYTRGLSDWEVVDVVGYANVAGHKVDPETNGPDEFVTQAVYAIVVRDAGAGARQLVDLHRVHVSIAGDVLRLERCDLRTMHPTGASDRGPYLFCRTHGAYADVPTNHGRSSDEPR